MRFRPVPSHSPLPDVIFTYAQELHAQPPSIVEGFLQILSVPLNGQGHVDSDQTQQLIIAAHHRLRT